MYYKQDFPRSIAWEKEYLALSDDKLISLPEHKFVAKAQKMEIFPPCGANNHKFTLVYQNKSLSYPSLYEAKKAAEDLKDRKKL